MKGKCLFVILVTVLALVVAAPAFAAGPVITDLVSTSHPSQDQSFYNNRPAFTWSVFAPYGAVATPGDALGVAVADGYAYVAQGYAGIQVVDLNPPASPALRGQWIDDYPQGYVTDVVVRGDYAYLSNDYYGGSIIILDISDPDAPQYVGSAWGFDYAQEIDVSDSYAYVAADGYGFRVLDVGNKTSPTQVGYFNTYCSGVDVDGSYAYLAAGDGLTVLDIGTPSNPKLAGHLDLPGARQVAVAGEYAYVTSGIGANGDDFHIVRIVDPAAPVEAGSCFVGGDLWDVAIDGSTAYVAAGDKGVRAVDVTDPTAPVTGRQFDTPGYSRDLAVENSLVYVADVGQGLVVLDPTTAPVTDFSYAYSLDATSDVEPDTIVGSAPSARLEPVADGEWWFSVRAIDSAGNWGPTRRTRVFVDHTIRPGYLISPTHPDQWASHYSNDPELLWGDLFQGLGTCQIGNAMDVAVAGDHAYVAARWNGLQVVDVSDPYLPRIVGRAPTSDDARGIAVQGGYAFMGGRGGQLRVIDIGDPSNPVVVGSCAVGGEAHGVVVIGDLAYVAVRHDYEAGSLAVVDIADKATPRLLASCELPGYAHDVDVEGGYAYVADGTAGLQIVALEGPSAMTIVAQVSDLGEVRGIDVASGFAYLAVRDEGLGRFVTVDVTEPGAPRVAASVGTPGQGQDVAVVGGLAYYADRSYGVKVFDLADASSPVLAAAQQTLGPQARGVAAVGGLLYVADQNSGLHVMDPVGTRCAYSFTLDQTSDVEIGTDPYGFGYSAVYGDVQPNGEWWFHLRALSPEGDWGPTQQYRLDIAHWPTISYIYSPTHGDPWSWSANNDPEFRWYADVPCDAYSYAVDLAEATDPDQIPDPVADLENPSASFTDVPDGVVWFHVRARDVEGNWGPAAHYSIRVKTKGPVTMALGYRTAKRGAIWLQFAVSDIAYVDYDWDPWYRKCDVTIEILSAAGKTVWSMPLGLRQAELTHSVALNTTLPKGRYTFVVHAMDWLGNPESQAGRASLVVR